MREKRLGKMQVQQRLDFTEVKKRQAQQSAGNGRHDADVRHLAEAAGGIIVSVAMRVGDNLQQEKQGDERQRQGHGHG